MLCFAATRSGKGIGLVVPTLRTRPASAIFHDIKGENWTLTAGWRARFSRVLLFDSTNAASAAQIGWRLTEILDQQSRKHHRLFMHGEFAAKK